MILGTDLQGWPEVDRGDLSVLPPSLRAIVRALGWARAEDFLRQHGGLVVHVPVHKAQALGLDADEFNRLQIALKRQLSGVRGRYIALPKADKLFRVQRNRQISRDVDKLSVNQLAKKYGITSRHVLNLKLASKTVKNQANLPL